MSLGKISERLRTQDNRITQNPMFCVQVLRRDIGYDAAYIENTCWRDSANEETIYDDDKDFKGEPEGDEWEMFGYVDRWETVMVAFTQKGCEEYLGLNGHNDRARAFRGQVRIYVDSFNRCPEMIWIREFIMRQSGPLRKFLVEYGGGAGPDVWHAEMTVDAVGIPDAHQTALGKVEEIHGHITCISEAP